MIDNRLGQILDKKKITRADLAEKIEVSDICIYKYISGKCYPTLPHAIKIARILDVNVEDIWIA